MRKIDADFMTSKIFAKRLAIDNKNCLYYIFLSRDKSCHRNIIIIIVLIESEKMTHFASKKNLLSHSKRAACRLLLLNSIQLTVIVLFSTLFAILLTYSVEEKAAIRRYKGSTTKRKIIESRFFYYLF